MGLVEFGLVLRLNETVGFGEVEVLAEIVNVQLYYGLCFAVLPYVHRTVVGWDLHDFIEGGLIDVLTVLVDGSDGAVGLASCGVYGAEGDGPAVICTFSVKD